MTAKRFVGSVLVLVLVTGCGATKDQGYEVPADPSPVAASGTGGTMNEVVNAGGVGDEPAEEPSAGNAGAEDVPMPSAGTGGMGGIQSVEPLGGMGGLPSTSQGGNGGAMPICCSGKYNLIGQCVDDGTVCTAGMAGMAGMGGTGGTPTCRTWITPCTHYDAFGECQAYGNGYYECGCANENKYRC